MADIIKTDDNDFDQQAEAMRDFINNPTKRALLGLSSADANALDILWAAWNTAFPAHKAHVAEGTVITAGKNAARAPLEDKMRAFAKVFRARRELGNITDQHLAEVGIPPLGQPTNSGGTPETKPVVTIDASQRQRHELNWRDEATPTKTARPSNARTCEIRVTSLPAGTLPPENIDTWPYHALDPKTPHLIIYDIEDLGKEAWVAARWIANDGTTGPWSTVVHSTILR